MARDIYDSIESVLRSVQSILESFGAEYRLVKLDDGALPQGTIEIELEEVWSKRDVDAAFHGILTDQWLHELERMGWALVTCSDDGRTFRIRPTTITSIVGA